MKNYFVKGKKVYADIPKLSEKELREVNNYKVLGFEIIPRKEKKVASKEIFKAATIQKWLEANATKEQQKKYWEVFNAPVIDKETKEIKLKKDGTPKKKGHVAGLAWFKKEFPQYLEQ